MVDRTFKVLPSLTVGNSTVNVAISNTTISVGNSTVNAVINSTAVAISGIVSYPVPAGAVMAFAMTSVPTGWLECNGSSQVKATYPALNTAIGTTFGAGNTTHFVLPDLRGEFIRGYDNGRGIDSGRVFGSFQADDFESHTHTASTNSTGNHTHDISANEVATTQGGGGLTRLTALNNGASGSVDGTTSSDGAHSHTVTVVETGGTETRPRNIALMYCIKT